MKKLISTTILLAVLTTVAMGQRLTQTVRGTITDTDSKLPLIGATISIPGTNPFVGTATDVNGNFRLEKIPVGRITLQVSYLGYEPKTLSDIEVNSGKEIVLDVALQEAVNKVEEVIITANRKKGEAVNEMSTISSRSISVTETKRYTGGMDDPARVVSSFAGVTSSPDGSSDIIVRGNSPKYLQWRIDGIEISSPYHMDDQNASFGALTALNNSLLATSDFHTGAFSPEYGNVLASVMDIKLRPGNNEKFESSFGAGILGIDLTLEGPFKKGYAGSYLVNYRYSTVTLIKKLGLVDVKGAVDYQDATFKLVLPSKKAGTFSVFGLAGMSGFAMKDIRPGNFTTPDGNASDADISKDFNKKAYLSNIGLTHTLNLNSGSFIKTTLSYSGTGMDDDLFEVKIASDGTLPADSAGLRNETFRSRIVNSSYRISSIYNNRLDPKNKIQTGIKYSLNNNAYGQDVFDPRTQTLNTVTDFNKYIGTLNSFVSWKHNFNDNIFIIAGLHNMNVLFNHKSTLEPRLALTWKVGSTGSIHAGYGKHSMMESIHNYFAIVKQPDGTETEPNRNLGLLKADHFVLGYEKRFTPDLVGKAEIYYQHLYDLPVENNDTSYYSTINEGTDYRYVALVNRGKGKNYGIELTLERFFDDHYYFLVNGSLFDSKYKTLDGTWRNTMFNGNYMVNVLCGKEFKNLGKKQNKTLAINSKIFFGGGRRYIPLLRDAQGSVAVDPANGSYFDYSKAYDNRLDNIFQLNMSVNYKINRAGATHEIFLDLMNLTNNLARITEYYDGGKPDKISYLTQFGFFPNLMYRVYF